jgi:hypothetical protein
MSAPPTSATGSSSSPGLPTPRARDWKRGGKDGLEELLFKTPTAQLAVNGGSQHPDKRKEGGHGPTLADEVEHLLPTPRASETGTPGRRASDGFRPPLSEVVLPLLPTPTASNPNDGEDLESWEARRQRNLAKGVNGNGQGTPLGVAVRLLPTPRASDGEKGGPNQRGSSGDLTLPSAAVRLLPTPTTQAHARNRTANRADPKPSTNTKSQTLLDVFWTGDSTPPPSSGGST